MAKVEITIDKNEYELFDYTLAINGVDVGLGENYTKIEQAEYDALEAMRKWVTRGSGDAAAV